MSVPNEEKLIIHAINIHKPEFVMVCYTSIPFVENTLKKFRIVSGFHSVYIHNFHHDKQGVIDELFCQYIETLLKYIYRHELIQ